MMGWCLAVDSPACSACGHKPTAGELVYAGREDCVCEACCGAQAPALDELLEFGWERGGQFLSTLRGAMRPVSDCRGKANILALRKALAEQLKRFTRALESET